LGQFDAPQLGDGPATVLVRPEQLRFQEEGFAATIRRVRFGGAFYEIEAVCGGIELVVRTPVEPPDLSAQVLLGVAPGGAHVIAGER
jgi:hypothetical protein